LEDTDIVNYFLIRTPILHQIIARIYKWGCIKLKSFYTRKESTSRFKRQPTYLKKIFTGYSTSKGLIFRIYKELKKLNSKRTNNPIIK
jgi:hypothetical protein